MLNQTSCSRPTDDRAHAARFFDEYLPRLVGRPLLNDCRWLDCRFDVHLTTGPRHTYSMAIAEGTLVAWDLAPGPPQVVYSLDAGTLLDVVTARCTPQDAFFAMQVVVAGDMERGLELGAVFEDLFRFHPYRMEQRKA